MEVRKPFSVNMYIKNKEGVLHLDLLTMEMCCFKTTRNKISVVFLTFLSCLDFLVALSRNPSSAEATSTVGSVDEGFSTVSAGADGSSTRSLMTIGCNTQMKRKLEG